MKKIGDASSEVLIGIYHLTDEDDAKETADMLEEFRKQGLGDLSWYATRINLYGSTTMGNGLVELTYVEASNLTQPNLDA